VRRYFSEDNSLSDSSRHPLYTTMFQCSVNGDAKVLYKSTEKQNCKSSPEASMEGHAIINHAVTGTVGLVFVFCRLKNLMR
jgi:hypothetical protein